MVKNRNDVNSDFNIDTQNDNQHLCLGVVMAFRKKRLMEYIWTLNGSTKIILKVS